MTEKVTENKSLFIKLLTKNKNKDIVVVTIDGQAFKGKLVDFDNECLVLDNVVERKAEWGPWSKPLVTLPQSDKAKVTTTQILGGSTGLTLAKLQTVAIRLATISRIWEWLPQELEEGPWTPV
jgi:small nuclear ribonucleoprotein (snRNP)-like protein